MLAKGINESCIEQIYRLFAKRLYDGAVIPIDKEGRIRIDDLEMRADVQEEVLRRWKEINDENIAQYTDLKGYHAEFLKLFGFGLNGVDYQADVEPDIKLPQ